MRNVEKARKIAGTKAGIFTLERSAKVKREAGKQALLNALVLLEVVKHCQSLQSSGNLDIPTEMMKGAHVLIEDNGELSNFLSGLDATKSQVANRYSSHYLGDKEQMLKTANPGLSEDVMRKQVSSGKPDFSLRAEIIFNECVFGKFERNDKSYTWIQFEGHSHQPRTSYNSVIANVIDSLLQLVNYSIEKFNHHLDFVSYAFFHKKQKNVGQYGNSIHTEFNKPIELVDEKTNTIKV